MSEYQTEWIDRKEYDALQRSALEGAKKYVDSNAALSKRVKELEARLEGVVERQWIPTSKSLTPDREGTYWITYLSPIYGGSDVTPMFWDGSRWMFFGEPEKEFTLTVTAFMVSPEPYKQEKNDGTEYFAKETK